LLFLREEIHKNWMGSMTNRNKIPLLILVLIGALAGLVLQVQAQTPQPAGQTPASPSDDDVNRVAKQMFCPVCENIPLDVCPTQACHDWRELIRQKLAAGWTDEQIKQYFAAQYGDRVLAEPPRRGLNWLVYVLPFVFLAGGAVLLWRVLSSMRSARPAGPDANAPAAPAVEQDEYVKKLEEELKKRQ
jgi:cytochrome c-type biogenesis protein CcmH